jgi:putative ABC transport system permease protein
MKGQNEIRDEHKHGELPSWARRFIRSICPRGLAEEIEGDLIQKYKRDVKRFSGAVAKRKLAWNAIRFFRPGIILRNKVSFGPGRIDILWTYFKVSYRHLLKSKSYSLINVMALAVGLTAFVLITQYVSFEKSYDRFHKNGNEIFRLAQEFRENERSQIRRQKIISRLPKWFVNMFRR